MNSETLQVFKRNTEVVSIPVVDETGAPYALAGLICMFIIKKLKSDLVELILKTALPEDIVGNVVTFGMDPAETDKPVGNYWYEVIITDSLGSPTIYKSVASGVFVINRSLKTLPVPG